MDNKKILLAFSGGVDSSACVELLRKQGYDVFGLYIRFSPAHDDLSIQAKKVAEELCMPLSIVDVQPQFEKHVVHPFCSAYTVGRTPNPCVVCNPLVKFATLCSAADDAGIFHVATGHYACISQQDNTYYVSTAKSLARDQSYMLYRLSQDVLSRLVLPAGEFEKQQVRQIATDLHLSNADAPDSQEICFIPSGDYPQYILDGGFQSLQGDFISPNGENLGPHKGVLHYTIGQRKGLGIALGQPVFVKSILQNGNVHLCYSDGLLSSEIKLTDCMFTPLLCDNSQLFVKIRSMAKPVACHFDKDTFTVVFDTPQRAPAPGQHAVFYLNGLVLGGGVIDSVAFA